MNDQQTPAFDQFTRWCCPSCSAPTIDSFHKTVWDGLPWDDEDTPPDQVPGITSDCYVCGAALCVSYPAAGEAPRYFRTGTLAGPKDDQDARIAELTSNEDAAWAAFRIDPRAGETATPSAERDGDWSGGCLAVTPAPPLHRSDQQPN